MPPHGRNPEVTPDNLDPYEHVGPLARTVADCALIQNVGAGPHPEDAATLRQRLRKLNPLLRLWAVHAVHLPLRGLQ